MSDTRQRYYEHLVAARQQAYADYDKTLVALAGGAFGVSALFTEKLTLAPPTSVALLFWAWVLWGLTLLVVLSSFLLSELALTKALTQLSEVKLPESQGGWAAKATIAANLVGLLCFIVGLALFGLFIAMNLEGV